MRGVDNMDGFRIGRTVIKKDELENIVHVVLVLLMANVVGTKYH